MDQYELAANSAPNVNTATGRVVTPAVSPAIESNQSALSWSAVFAGAAASAVLSLVLLLLGTGLGLSSMSPWTGSGISATAVGISAIVWITVSQLIASGLGGYLAGRLRTKWSSVHGDEMHFRDTAHGFLAWAVATLVTAMLLASTISSIVSGGVQAGASVASGAATAMATAGAAAAPALAGNRSSTGASGNAASDYSMSYFVDSLFRRDANSPAPVDSGNTSPAAETTRIFTNAISTGTMPPEDVRYVGQYVSQRTGLNQADAEKRVTDTFNQMQTKLQQAQTKAKDIADQARKASAYASLWLFISLLIGAFAASLSATWGGRQRQV